MASEKITAIIDSVKELSVLELEQAQKVVEILKAEFEE